MCSVLIFVVDGNAPGAHKSHFQRGDIVDVHPKHKWFWGTSVQGPNAEGAWRVIQIPDAPHSAVESLPQTGPRPDGAAGDYCLRAHTVDVDALEALIAAAAHEPAVVAWADFWPLVRVKDHPTIGALGAGGVVIG